MLNNTVSTRPGRDARSIAPFAVGLPGLLLILEFLVNSTALGSVPWRFESVTLTEGGPPATLNVMWCPGTAARHPVILMPGALDSNAQPSCHLVCYTLRTDGFVSVNAPFAGGEFVTKPVTFTGREMVVNFSTGAAGRLRVELQNAAGEPLPGFALADAVDQVGDEIDRVVGWKAGRDVGRLAGNAVRLRFVMQDADLYSLRFR